MAGCQGNPTLNRGMELSVPTPDFQGGERGWKLNQPLMITDLTNHAYVMKPPEKPKRRGFEELPVWENRMLPHATMPPAPDSTGTEPLLFRTWLYVSLHLADSYPLTSFVENQ